jgi:hypothetical protein
LGEVKKFCKLSRIHRYERENYLQFSSPIIVFALAQKLGFGLDLGTFDRDYLRAICN